MDLPPGMKVNDPDCLFQHPIIQDLVVFIWLKHAMNLASMDPHFTAAYTREDPCIPCETIAFAMSIVS